MKNVGREDPEPLLENDDEQSPFPEIGDKLFVACDVDWQYNAWIKKFGSNWYPYIEGYRQAADLLIEHIINDSRYGLDCLIYPITFLYRHHLELRLKAIILDGSKLLDLKSTLPTHHDIFPLWLQCRHILTEVWPEGPHAALDAIEAFIKEFCTIDKKSMSFRYPVDKAGNPSSSSVPGLINVRHLAETMTKMANLLDGAHTGIQAYLDSKTEIEAYYQDFNP